MNLEQLLTNANIQIDNEKVELLARYCEILLEWNQIHNLSGAKTAKEIYQNIIDSIYPIKFIKEPKTLLDIGSGAGFPGMALGIIWSGCETTLCEPRNKRASFLKFVSIELGLSNIKVEKKRVENLKASSFELITSRAVNKVETLLNISKHLSQKETKYLLFKGERVFDEVKSLDLDYEIFKRDKRNYLLIRGLGESQFG